MMKSSQGSSTAGDHQNLQQQHSNTDKNGHSNTSIKVAKFIARHPYKCFFATLLLTFIITGIAAMSGLEVSIDSTGWRSRNTLIAKREMQNEIIVRFKNELFQDTNGTVWEDLENNVVRGFQLIEVRADPEQLQDEKDQQKQRMQMQMLEEEDDLSLHLNLFHERQLSSASPSPSLSSTSSTPSISSSTPSVSSSSTPSLSLSSSPSTMSPFENCNAEKYYTTMLAKNNLFAMYKTDSTSKEKTGSTKSILDKDALYQICNAETITHEALQQNGVCGGCTTATDTSTTQKCLPPHSLILLLKMKLNVNVMDNSVSCSQLMDMYTQEIQNDFTNTLVECVQEINDNYDPLSQSYGITTKCPDMFQVNLVDKDFGIDGNSFLRYTSSYFITSEVDDEELYNVRSYYGNTDESIVTVVYDTITETQTEIYSETLIIPDMTLALGSLLITFTAMAIHTKSMWLTMVGVMQIIFSVPLGVFIYVYVAGIRFFPFLNLIGIFVAAALGADYVFVAVDKWKNARLENQAASTEDIAALALPNAASAMFLTTSTTVVAFFSTMICPVAPILCFALFCGLLIMFNYFMNLLLLFPALCLYDIWLKNGSRNILTNFRCCSRSIAENDPTDNGTVKQSLIHRVLSSYYHYLHKFRYGLLIACLVVTAWCIQIALTMSLPDSADVRVLPEGNAFELHNKWKQELLSFRLFYSGGSFGQVTWGIEAADTGAKNDPDSLSTLVLDETFNPSTTESQKFMLGFCDRLFDTDIVQPINVDSLCPLNEFDSWLKHQFTSSNQTAEYVENCNNADSVPMSEDNFDKCIIAFSELTNNRNILEKKGKVKIIRLRVKNGVSWDAPFAEMDKFWTGFESFLENERSYAPSTSNKFFHTASAYWWYDTNISMLATAIGACIIAVIFSTVIVLISSRSITLTIFSALCITYVLAATTSSLVGLGWSLGFLESVCFAILVGISCDFVIHFGHAYNYLDGETSRFERTKYAVIHMGPSILAAAFTTFAAALTMLFCQITFFQKFALILLMTILHATLASFVIYLVFTDSFGPSEPTKFFDGLFVKIKGLFAKDEQRSNESEYDGKPTHDFYTVENTFDLEENTANIVDSQSTSLSAIEKKAEGQPLTTYDLHTGEKKLILTKIQRT